MNSTCILRLDSEWDPRRFVQRRTLTCKNLWYLGAGSPHCYEIFSKFQLLDVIFREDTLWNVIQSVTRNGRSIILTAILALILVYMFSIIGFLFLKDDFLIETDPSPKLLAGESRSNFRSCVIVYTFFQLR